MKPVCLFFFVTPQAGSGLKDLSGYPPPDKTARAYLSWTTSQQEARVHAVAFLRAVFQVASELITDLRRVGKNSHEQIVDSFRKHMSDGMKWGSHGAQRLSFYDKVDSGAREVR